jgi:hypothetical protein
LVFVALAVISLASALLFFFKCHENKWVYQTFISIENSDKLKQDETFTRELVLLKSDLVRTKVIQENNLYGYFGVNEKSNYSKIVLDKNLHENLLVENQLNGSILVSFMSKDSLIAKEVVNDLIETSKTFFYLDLANKNVEINYVKTNKYNNHESWEAQLLTLVFLVCSPVLLVFIIFIAVKEKLYLELKNE